MPRKPSPKPQTQLDRIEQTVNRIKLDIDYKFKNTWAEQLATDEGKLIAAIGYSLIGVLTFGSRYSAWESACTTHSECDAFGHGILAIVSGLLWPLYWLGHIAIAIFQ